MTAKKYIILILLFIYSDFSSAQDKQEIDMTAISNWHYLRKYDLSPNGRYVWYEVSSNSGQPVLYLSDTEKNRTEEFSGAGNPAFSNDSRYLIFSVKDEASYFDLNSWKQFHIPGARDINLVGNGGRASISYTKDEKLFISGLPLILPVDYGKMKKVLLSPDGGLLVMVRDSVISILNVESGATEKIPCSDEIAEIVWSKNGTELCYITSDSRNSILYHVSGFLKHKLVVKSVELRHILGKNNKIGALRFTEDAYGILFESSQDEAKPEVRPGQIKGLKIWSYRDDYIQSNLAWRNKPAQTFFINLRTTRISRLWTDTTGIYQTYGKYAIMKTDRNEGEAYWDDKKQNSYYLKVLTTEEESAFIPKDHRPDNVSFSKFGKYITWTDTVTSYYYCYNTATKKLYNVSSFIRSEVPMYDEGSTYILTECWTKDDQYAIIRDRYDLYCFNPSSGKGPICITNEYGRHYKMEFRLAQVNIDDVNERVLCSVKEESTGKNGFALAYLKKNEDPKIKFLDECIYYHASLAANLTAPIKSRQKNIYLTTRQTSNRQPNLYLIKNFEYLQAITSIDNSKSYNWFNAEMVKYKDHDNIDRFGILYTPANLDSTRKYPVIFNYYMERTSTERFEFKAPDITYANINIPWFLSRGYAVCVPDIKREKGNTGVAALESVEGMAKYLTNNFKWIDNTKLGLQGQSFGGYISNFIATHSNMFAAAQASSGLSDFITEYGGLGFGQKSLQNMTEIGQLNMGVPPWEDPLKYINNSAIFTVNKTTTPLLMLHGSGDGVVNINQSVSLFTALRRVKKPVWLLEYREGHIIGKDTAQDFTIRLQQFFDHYLKGKPAPLWMVESIQSLDTDMQRNLQLDSLNRLP